MKRQLLAIPIFVLAILFINYAAIDSFLIKTFDGTEYGVVERIVDGDTIKINGTSIRMLGINTPEKGEIGAEEAKKFLEAKILNRTVRLISGKEKYDLYGRRLAYVFIGTENVNLESVKNGYSNFYFPQGRDSYYDSFQEAWQNCLNENKNLCEHSKNICINVKEWNYKNDYLILQNMCDKKINLENWSIKDEGRKKYVFGNLILEKNAEVKLTSVDWNKTYVWTSSGDSLFVRDAENKLVYWQNY